jgi:hypothetical protein
MAFASSNQSAAMSLVLGIVCFALSAQTLAHDFVFDDHSRIPFVTNIGSWYEAFVRPSWPGNLYRPIETVSFLLTERYGAGTAFAYHLGNVLLHFLVTLSVFLLVKQLFDLKRGFICALIFAVHPLHSEVIANISNRSEMLAALGIILSCLFSIRLQSASRAWAEVVGLALSTALAVFGKENGVHVALLGPLCVWFLGIHIRPRFAWTVIVIASVVLLYVGIRAIVLENVLLAGTISAHDNPLVRLSKPLQVWNALCFLGQYIVLSFIPFHISAVSGFPKYVPVMAITDTSLASWTYLLVLVLMSTAAVYGFRQRKAYSFWCAWFLLSMVVTSNVVVLIGTIFGDRLAYVATVGSSGVLADLLLRSGRQAGIVLLPLLLSVYFLLAFRAIGYWKDDFTLFKHEAVQSPRNALAHSRYGIELFRQGKWDEAKSELQLALQLFPKNVAPLPYLAATEVMTGRHQSAAAYLNKYQLVAPGDETAKLLRVCTEKPASSPCETGLLQLRHRRRLSK